MTQITTTRDPHRRKQLDRLIASEPDRHQREAIAAQRHEATHPAPSERAGQSLESASD